MRIRSSAAAFAAALFCSTASFAAPATDPCAGVIPDTPLKGTLNGKPFTEGDATIYSVNFMEHYDGYFVGFSDKPGEANFTLQAIVPKRQKPDGKTFAMIPSFDPSKQPMAGKDTPQISMFSLSFTDQKFETFEFRDLATIRVELGTRANGSIPGKLAMCIPGKGLMMSGTFSAKFITPQ